MSSTISLDSIRQQLNSYISSHFPTESTLSAKLLESMGYAVLGGGKRLRGSLVCATALSLGAEIELALAPAAAVEYLHTYSLIHDDLPDMDNSALRRGKPSVHAKFGSTTAILAGDALQSLAFSTIADCIDLSTTQRVECISILASASGFRGMVDGQALDMELEQKENPPTELIESLLKAKTGALFRASITMGAVVGNAAQGTSNFNLLDEFGTRIGLAFQIVDDLLDATGETDNIGKPTQADTKAGKKNFASQVGIQNARQRASSLLDDALARLDEIQLRHSPIAEIARACVNRSI